MPPGVTLLSMGPQVNIPGKKEPRKAETSGAPSVLHVGQVGNGGFHVRHKLVQIILILGKKVVNRAKDVLAGSIGEHSEEDTVVSALGVGGHEGLAQLSGGFVGDGFESADEGELDAHDIKALYDVLLNEVIPAYYENKNKWIEMMQASIKSCKDQFSVLRMLEEYYEKLYMA